MNLNNKLSNIKDKIVDSIEGTLPEIEIVRDKITSLKSKEIKQRPAKYEIVGMTATIYFRVHIDDLIKYYRDGNVYVEKDNSKGGK